MTRRTLHMVVIIVSVAILGATTAMVVVRPVSDVSVAVELGDKQPCIAEYTFNRKGALV
jgi:hypothetical protein